MLEKNLERFYTHATLLFGGEFLNNPGVEALA